MFTKREIPGIYIALLSVDNGREH